MSIKKQRITYTVTATTYDSDAIAINNALNDVKRMIEIGQQLQKILDCKFNGSMKSFRRYIRMNLDKDEKSIIRYMTLAANAEMLQRRGIIRLSEAYEILGIDGNMKEVIDAMEALQ